MKREPSGEQFISPRPRKPREFVGSEPVEHFERDGIRECVVLEASGPICRNLL